MEPCEESVSFKIGLSPEGRTRQLLREKGLSDAEIEAVTTKPGFSNNIGFLASAIAEAKGYRALRIRMLEESGFPHDSAVSIAELYGGPPSIDWLGDITFQRDKDRELKIASAISLSGIAVFTVMVFVPAHEMVGMVVGFGSLAVGLFGIRLVHENLRKRKQLADQQDSGENT